MNENNALPHRFREKAFRRYEETIKQIADSFPEPVCFNTKDYDLSSVTFSCRLRDAIRSLREHQWAPTTVNMARFIQCVDEIVVQDRGDHVAVGSAERLKAQSAWIQQSIESSPPADLQGFDLNTIARLAALRVLHTPVIVSCSENEANECQKNYDVALEKRGNDDNSYLLI